LHRHHPTDQLTKAQAERMRACSVEEINAEIGALVPGAGDAVLLALLENSQLQQSHLLLLLEHRELSAAILERIAARKQWLRDPALRRSLVAHIHTPPWLATKLARDLDITDLLTISFRPSVPAEVRRFADELLLAHLPQLSLGQKLSLARKGPGRIAAELLAGGDPRVARVSLDNAYLTEAQLLRILANDKLLAGALIAVATHAKWSAFANVRAALLSHSNTPLEQIVPLLPRLSQGDLDRLSQSPELRSDLRDAIQREYEARSTKESHLDTPRTRT
jgi:hypothetical protein